MQHNNTSKIISTVIIARRPRDAFSGHYL